MLLMKLPSRSNIIVKPIQGVNCEVCLNEHTADAILRVTWPYDDISVKFRDVFICADAAHSLADELYKVGTPHE